MKRKIGQTEIIYIDKEEEGPQERTLWDTRKDRDRIGINNTDSNQLGSTRKVRPEPRKKWTGNTNSTKFVT